MLPADLRAGSAAEPASEPSPVATELPYPEARRLALETFDRLYVEARLVAAGGNVTEAARSMGIARQSLQAKLKELGVDPARFRLREP